jgi:hypothetical protein
MARRQADLQSVVRALGSCAPKAYPRDAARGPLGVRARQGHHPHPSTVRTPHPLQPHVVVVAEPRPTAVRDRDPRPQNI